MLKRFVSLLLAAVMLLSLVGCTDTATEKPLAEVSFLDQIETGSVTVPETDYVDTAVEKPLTVESVLALINTDRLEEMSYVPESIMEISQSHEYDNLLSHEECQMLLEEKYPTGDVTKEQAIEDAEYLWKAFASAYGGYYYFGDDTFKNAHQQMINDINAYEGDGISYDTFDDIASRAYGFIKDRHIRFFQDIRYAVYYVRGLFIREDMNGFYTLISGQKWYLRKVDKGSINDYIHITIADTGELMYGFYCRFASDTDNSMPKTLTVERGSETMELSLTWKKSGAIGWDQANTFGRFYATENIDGHNVVKIRSFGYFLNDGYAEELEKYMETGNFLSGQDYVIIDSRSNGGGSNGCPSVWMNRFLGNSAADMDNNFRDRLESSKVTFFVRSRLYEYASKQRYPDFIISENQTEYPRERIITYAEQTKNEHPMFVLTDYMSGSAGEAIITQYRTVENVLIIGTNTDGCMFGSVELYIQLPNTGYNVGFAQGVSLEDFVNREGYGYDPDIWVPSEYALELTLQMCEFYGLSDPDAQPLPTYGEVPERVDLSGYR